MEVTINFDAIYVLSEDVVAREIEGQLIIVPLTAGMGDTEGELYTLNETGKVIWQRLDGQRSLRAIAQVLAEEYDVSADVIERDVLGLVGELARRKIVVPQS